MKVTPPVSPVGASCGDGGEQPAMPAVHKLEARKAGLARSIAEGWSRLAPFARHASLQRA
ncbi:hypothetical protein DOI34_26395 [Salmonella enterica subsp. enterica serovar Virchow]|nr:hypothetical protein [Salmonella enterica subsp. enterica serovar Virchow]